MHCQNDGELTRGKRFFLSWGDQTWCLSSKEPMIDLSTKGRCKMTASCASALLAQGVVTAPFGLALEYEACPFMTTPQPSPWRGGRWGRTIRSHALLCSPNTEHLSNSFHSISSMMGLIGGLSSWEWNPWLSFQNIRHIQLCHLMYDLGIMWAVCDHSIFFGLI